MVCLYKGSIFITFWVWLGKESLFVKMWLFANATTSRTNFLATGFDCWMECIVDGIARLLVS